MFRKSLIDMHEEDHMVELTDSARTELDGYFAEHDKACIRIFLASGGCSGPRLALALDEPAETDEKYVCNGYDFIVDKSLAQEAGTMTVDMTYMGFQVHSDLKIPQGGGCGCGSSAEGACGSGCGSDSGGGCCC